MQKIRRIISRFIFPIILLLSIPAVRYLFVDGFFGVSDDLHIAWLYEMDRAIKTFQIPPRLVPDLSFGFGYPLFNFVYPLPFYVGEIFHVLGFSLVDSIKIVYGLSIPFSMYFMYKLLKEFVNEEFSLAGSVLYVYMPYRATELFVRGTIGEITAFMFLPLIALSIVNLTKEKDFISKKWIGVLGISVCGLVLSHNIMAYMFMPFVLLILVLRIIFISKNKMKSILFSFSGLLLGLVSSSYFWLPALSESSLVKYDTVFNFYDHFPTLKQFITPFFGYGASVPGPYDTMSFYVGITGIFVVILGTIFFLVKYKNFTKSEKIFVYWGIFILLFSIFMMNHRSAFLWETLPLLPYFQFPWRFITMIAFASPILLIGFSKYKGGAVISSLVLVSALVLNFSYFKTSEYLGRTDDYYINRYIPVPVASEEYKKLSEEYLRLPLNTEVRPSKNYPIVYANEPGGILEVSEINPLKIRVETDYGQEFLLNYSKYYFPGWVAKMDGEHVEIKPGKPYGQITVSIPSGRHTIEIFFKETKERMFYNVLSLAGIGFILYLIFKKK